MEGTYYYLCELAQFQDNKLFNIEFQNQSKLILRWGGRYSMFFYNYKLQIKFPGGSELSANMLTPPQPS